MKLYRFHLSGLRLCFVLSLFIMAVVLVVFVYFLPGEESYAELNRLSVIRGDNEWTLQCNVINDSENSIRYTILMNVDGTDYKNTILVMPGKTYKYINRVSMENVDEGRIVFSLFENQNPEPVKHAVYHIGDY